MLKCVLFIVSLSFITTADDSDETEQTYLLEVSSSSNGWLLELWLSETFQERIESNHFCSRFTKDGQNGTESCNKEEEGLKMTLINQNTGVITLRKTFKTWKFWVQWNNLMRHLSYVPSGRIVVFSFSGQGSSGLRYAVPHLVSLGSLLSPHLSPNSSWIWIFANLGKTLYEACPQSGHPTVNASIPLSVSSVNLISDEVKDPFHLSICQSYELLGDICDANMNGYVAEIIKPPVSVYLKSLENVPIVIQAGSRLGYFSYTLKTLLTTPGIIKENVIALIGGLKYAFVDVAKLYGVKYKTLKMVGFGNAKLFQYYRLVYKYVSEMNSTSPAAIFIDEDVEVSPDFFFYFNQTLPLLQEDESLYCVNAFATGRSSRLTPDPSKVLRANAQVAWGYGVSLSFINEALAQWPTNSSLGALFDQFLMMAVSNGRDCVFPDQTRSLHFGSDGMNSKDSFDFELYNLMLQPVPTYGHELTNIRDISLPEWTAYLQRDLQNATILRGHPCTRSFIPNEAKGSFALYYLFAGSRDALHFFNFMAFGLCLGFWSFSLQGIHDGVTTLRPQQDVVLHLVAVPMSNLSAVLPPYEPVLDALLFTSEERKMLLEFKDNWEIEERQRFLNRDQKRRVQNAMRSLFLEINDVSPE